MEQETGNYFQADSPTVNVGNLLKQWIFFQRNSMKPHALSLDKTKTKRSGWFYIGSIKRFCPENGRTDYCAHLWKAVALQAVTRGNELVVGEEGHYKQCKSIPQHSSENCLSGRMVLRKAIITTLILNVLMTLSKMLTQNIKIPEICSGSVRRLNNQIALPGATYALLHFHLYLLRMLILCTIQENTKMEWLKKSGLWNRRISGCHRRNAGWGNGLFFIHGCTKRFPSDGLVALLW